MANPFEDIKVLFTKNGELDKTTQPYILNRFLSFNKSTFGISNKLNKYIFWIDKELSISIMDCCIPKQRTPFFQYVKKQKNLIDEEFNFILTPMKKYFNWTEEEFKAMYPLLKVKFKDKDFLYKCMCFVGCGQHLFKKQGFEFKEKEVIECQKSLSRWEN